MIDKEMMNAIRNNRMDNYIRGSRKRKVIKSVKEMARFIRKDDYDVDTDDIVKGIKIMIRESDVGVHDHHFKSFASGYVELGRKFNRNFQSQKVRDHLNRLSSTVFYQTSLKRLNAHIKRLSDRGKSALGKGNPSVQLAEQIVDTIGDGDG